MTMNFFDAVLLNRADRLRAKRRRIYQRLAVAVPALFLGTCAVDKGATDRMIREVAGDTPMMETPMVEATSAG